MLVVGLTGGIATGKSTVSTLLSASGIPVIDADVLAREAVAPGTHALSQIAAFFGPEVIHPDGSLDRKKLGSVVFNDDTKRKKLNSIVHPAVTRAILWHILKFWIRGERICVVDVPLLIEGGLWRWMGCIIVVYCSAEIQLQRLMSRDNCSRAEASPRLNSQLPITSKISYADIVIDNSGTRSELEDQVELCVKRLKRVAGSTWVVSWLFPPFGLLSAGWTILLRMPWRSRERNGARNEN
ncbi:dephospho-CoA kinase [Scleroderma citrinum]